MTNVINRLSILRLDKIIKVHQRYPIVKLFGSLNYKSLAETKLTRSNLNSQNFSIYSTKLSNSSKNTFSYIANETLESLTEKFDTLADEYPNLFNEEHDVTYSSNVLTIKLDSKRGTYVINTQTPNSQIWLSSPKSGPYRFDLVENNKWIYKHTGESLHELLTREFSELYKTSIDFTKCSFSGTIQRN